MDLSVRIRRTGIYNNIIDLLGDYVVLVGKFGNIRYASSNMVNITGYTSEQLELMGIYQLDQSLRLIDIRQIYAQKESSSWDSTWNTAHNQQLLVHIESKYVSYRDDSLLFWIITISEEGSAPKDGKDIQPSNFANWRWNLSNETFFASKNFYELFAIQEYGPNEKKDVQQFLSLLGKIDSSKQLNFLQKAIDRVQLTKESDIQLIDQQFSQENRKLLIHINPILEEDEIIEIFGSIYVLGKSDNHSLPQKTLARKMIDQLPMPILWMKENGNFHYVNKAATKSLYYNKEKFVNNLNISNIDIETDSQQWQDFWKQLKMGQAVRHESSFQRHDKTIMFVELHLTLLETYSEKLMCITAIDISDRRLREAQLETSLIETSSLRKRLETRESFFEGSKGIKIITQNKKYLQKLRQIDQVASSDATILITGETGTGKELLAIMAHEKSTRHDKPFVKVNCAALQEQIVESELFGHEKGAFTGAYKRKLGRFEIADHGTLFLDEIGELPLSTQSKLLRIIQSGEFERVGGSETIVVDVRLICATNRNLGKMIEEKQFRSDLFYRINTFPIENLPLRERKDDIPLLLHHFLEKHCKKMGKTISSVHEKDIERLQQYHFPGNVRELENIVERSIILTTGETLNLSHWQSQPRSTDNDNANQDRIFKTFEEMQRTHIVAALEKSNWKISGPGGAAQLLAMNDKTLYSKIKKLKIKIRK